jgi:hypothetical protein
MTFVTTYRGVNIWRNGPGYALPYVALTDRGQLAADTLNGLRRLIREGSDRP